MLKIKPEKYPTRFIAKYYNLFRINIILGRQMRFYAVSVREIGDDLDQKKSS